MKKMIQVFTVLLFLLIVLSSCNNSIEADAQKVANLQCKVQKLINDPTSLEKNQKLMTEINELTQKMQRKYSSLEEQQKFAQVLSEAMAKCN